jgi:hypothetical protein
MAESGGEEKVRGGTPTAFINYASQDAAVANSLVEALEQLGVRCWIAPRDMIPGSLYADGIVRAINGAKMYLSSFCRNMRVGSALVGKEIERASSKRRPIIAIHTDSAQLTPAFEYFLSASQWIELGPGGTDAAAARLVEAVRRHLDPSVAPPAPISAAATPTISEKSVADLHIAGQQLSQPVKFERNNRFGAENRSLLDQNDTLGFVGCDDRSRRTSVDLPPVIGELPLNDRGKAVSIVSRNY